MKPPPPMLVQPTGLQLLEDGGPGRLIQAEFRYDSADPFAVSLVVVGQESPAIWTFARELLAEGMSEPSGDGDVHVWPGTTDGGHPVVLIELTSPDQEALLAGLPVDIGAFLTSSYELVAPGRESDHLDLDAMIAAILSPMSSSDCDD